MKPLHHALSREVESAPMRRQTILVVDDVPAFCRVAALFLGRHCGYTVHTAGSVQEAISAAREMRRVDLLLADGDMPGLSGIELAEWFRAGSPDTAVVFVSENPRSQVFRRWRHLVEKPFVHLEVLENTIEQALDDRAARKSTPFAA